MLSHAHCRGAYTAPRGYFANIRCALYVLSSICKRRSVRRCFEYTERWTACHGESASLYIHARRHSSVALHLAQILEPKIFEDLLELPHEQPALKKIENREINF